MSHGNLDCEMCGGACAWEPEQRDEPDDLDRPLDHAFLVMEKCRAKLDMKRCRATVAHAIEMKRGTVFVASDEYVGLVATVDELRERIAELTKEVEGHEQGCDIHHVDREKAEERIAALREYAQEAQKQFNEQWRVRNEYGERIAALETEIATAKKNRCRGDWPCEASTECAYLEAENERLRGHFRSCSECNDSLTECARTYRAALAGRK